MLYGLGVTDASEPGDPKVTVAAGAALVPAGAAGEAWRLTILEADTTLDVPLAPAAQTRTDVVQLELTHVDDLLEQRRVRTVLAGGGEQAALQQVATATKPTGVASLASGVDAGDPQGEVDAVWLAHVTVDDTEVTAGPTELRTFAFPGVAGATGVAEGGAYFRGAMTMLQSVAERLSGVLAADGAGLGESLGGVPIEDFRIKLADGGGHLYTAAHWLAGGDGIQQLDLSGRRLFTTDLVVTSGVRLVGHRQPNGAGLIGANDYKNDADGLRMHGGTVVRAIAHVDAKAVGGTYYGENVESVTRLGAGNYEVVFEAAVFTNAPAAFGDLTSGRWRVRVLPAHVIGNGVARYDQAAVYKVFEPAAAPERKVELKTWVLGAAGAGVFGVEDHPFVVELMGPFDAAQQNVA